MKWRNLVVSAIVTAALVGCTRHAETPNTPGGTLEKFDGREIHARHRRHVIVIERGFRCRAGEARAVGDEFLHAGRLEKARGECRDGIRADLRGVLRELAALLGARVADVHDELQPGRPGFGPPCGHGAALRAREARTFSRGAAHERPRHAIAGEQRGLALDQRKVQRPIGQKRRVRGGDEAGQCVRHAKTAEG